MKRLLFATIIGLFMALPSQAQFSKAELQATGLTCALCSNAINKAVSELPFVESVKSDIKNSSFAIAFKKEATADIDDIKQAVEDAGFSVGSLKLTGHFDAVKVENDAHVKVGEEVFHFLEIKSQTLNGEQTIKVIDKDFVPAKQFKKYTTATKKACLQTGKTDAKSATAGAKPGTRVYHVTL